MSETLQIDSIPWSEPPCCPEFFICFCHGRISVECAQHHESPCGRAEAHASITREQWHDWADRWEQQLLDQHYREHLARA
ncbi:hypothetical protein OG497_38250 [Streptomyces sp. NBC_01242]|uniref:hypothetical protein n=1 Tax=Streptomyces sp. NBC_01242 TaxID=2903795 RepID=UPI002251A401|nr:hypothetical protein [Streptomyces sp. NBC_01242]MCX4799703.1 hypothetical protein [Streptomyces sp. NBC_01242]